ncbi:hypothetical protein Vretimale_4039, partial [Volvox reticuliferus]
QVALVALAARLQHFRLAQRCAHTTLPTSEELLAGHNGLVTDAVDKCPLDDPSSAQTLQRHLLLHANKLARDHRVALSAIPCEPPRPQQLGPAAGAAGHTTLALD